MIYQRIQCMIQPRFPNFRSRLTSIANSGAVRAASPPETDLDRDESGQSRLERAPRTARLAALHWAVEIYLRNLITRRCANILHSEAHVETTIAGICNLQSRIFEMRVGQAKSKRKQWPDSLLVKPAISDQNAFRKYAGAARVGSQALEMGRISSRIVRQLAPPRERQSPRRTHPAEQDVRCSPAALIAGPD
jgi:hypothetical protein